MIRSRPRLALFVLMLGAALATPGLDRRALAHGGEDHGAPAKPPTVDPNAPRLPIETQFLLGLRTQRAVRRALAPSLGQVGIVVPRPAGELVVGAPVAGRLLPPENGFVHLGDEVKKGQVLGILRPAINGAETAQLSLSRSDATARAASAAARLSLAERDLARKQGLKGVVADKDVQAAEADVAVARTDLARAQGDVGALSGSVGVQKLTSSLEGTVVLGRPSPGAQIAEGAEIWRIVDLSVLWVEVRLLEADAARLSGDRAALTPVAEPTVHLDARRVAVSSLIDPATRTVTALFEFDNRDHRVRVGTSMNVSAAGGAAVDSVVVPESALLERDGQPTLIVKTGPETFEVRKVALGARSAGLVGIAAGVQAGERVVVDGAMAVLMASGG